MKKLLLVFVLAGTFSANAKNNQPTNTVKASKEAITTDEKACRICLTTLIITNTGSTIGMTTCAGSIFTNCETAHTLAAQKLAKKALAAVFSAAK